MSLIRRSSRVRAVRWPAILGAIVLAGLAFLLAGETYPAFAATIVVNTDQDDLADNAVCSLREAIIAANTDAAYQGCSAGSGADTIEFNIPGTAYSVRSIKNSDDVGYGATPIITTPIIIDGWSQGVNDGTLGYSGPPLVEINGVNLTSAGGWGLRISGDGANGVTIRGLAINSFAPTDMRGIVVENGASNVTIVGNYIGLTADGTAAAGIQRYGISVTGATTANVTIGGASSAQRNVIGGTTKAITVDGGAGSVTIKGNYIGLNAAGDAAVSNSENGIYLDTSGSGFTIGGSAPGERNIISASVSGIVASSGASAITIKGNFIGTNAAGTAALPNTNGIFLTSVSNVTIGGSATGEGNLISGNSGDGIAVASSASSVTIKGNYVGTNAAGTAALGNKDGITVQGASNVTIGGSASGEGNLVSGNNSGIVIKNPLIIDVVTIKGNYVGLNAAGTAAIGNADSGIMASGAATNGVTIGGTTAGDRNAIAGSGGRAIYLFGGIKNVPIQGNYVGTNAAGTAALGNMYGIYLNSNGSGNSIGGTVTGAGNLISGNLTSGIFINGTPSGTTIKGNLLGTNAAGTGMIASGGTGIQFGNGATTVLIGGPTAEERNVVVGFTTAGIDSGTTDRTNTISMQGNSIGVMPNGTTAAGNGIGVRFQAGTGYTVGGTATGEGNVIANSAGSGVVITGANTRAHIRRNSIFNNGTTAAHLGIDLDNDGVTANDTLDTDTGANTRLNVPVLTSAGVGGGVTRLTGTLNSTANTTFQLDLYASPSCDASGNGEGQTFVGGTAVTTNASGNASFAETFIVATTPGQVITATTTDTTTGATSEFSACKTVVATGITVTPTSGLVTTESGGPATFIVQLAALPTSDVTIQVSSSSTNEGTVTPSTLTFAAGAAGLAAQTVAVTGVDDAIADGNVGYTVILAAASSVDTGYNGRDPTDVSVTNQDNEATPSLSVSNAQTTESAGGASSLAFTVTLNPASTQFVFVPYTLSPGTATGAGSCGAGVDFVNTAGMLTFTPGQTSGQITVGVCVDAISESDETLTLSLSTPSNATLGQSTATGTIKDDLVVSACSPRPRVVVETANNSDGRLRVRVATIVNPGRANELKSITWTALSNAVILGIGAVGQGQTTAFPPGTDAVTFFVERNLPTQPATARLVVTDACGSWPTLVGGGPGAF